MVYLTDACHVHLQGTLPKVVHNNVWQETAKKQEESVDNLPSCDEIFGRDAAAARVHTPLADNVPVQEGKVQGSPVPARTADGCSTPMPSRANVFRRTDSEEY